MTSAALSQPSYEDYGQWKHWAEPSFMQITADQARYWDKELAGVSVAGRDVLEIGFGNGPFLGWAKAQGARLSGTEIFAPARALAEKAGIALLPVDLAGVATSHAAAFDVVAAFDVMEHLTSAQNAALLENAAAMLRPGGHFIARFPNGQSPFGRFYQHGDHTHITALSANIIGQMIVGRPFALVRASNTAPQLGGGIARGIKRTVRYILQQIIETILRFTYAFDGPLGPNCVIVLQRLPAAQN